MLIIIYFVHVMSIVIRCKKYDCTFCVCQWILLILVIVSDCAWYICMGVKQLL